MSENDELARRLAEEQARADKEAYEELQQKIEAGFRLASQGTQQQQSDRQNREAQRQQERQQLEQDRNTAAQAEEYETESTRQAQEAGKDIAGNTQEQSFGYADNTQTVGTSYASDTDMGAQTDTYAYAQNANRNVYANSAENQYEETAENFGNAFYAEQEQHNAYAGQNQETTTQTDVDYNDPFAAWHAENQMRTATLDMNQSEQAMFNEQFNTVAPDSYSVGVQDPAMMGSYTQDLSNDDRTLYKTIRTANTDEYGPIKVGPESATQTANTQEKAAPTNNNADNRIYVNDQTFASRFGDTPFWNSDERKKAWDRFVDGFKKAKTLEELIENGLWAALEIGLDMINAHMDWEKSEAKKLSGFIKESKKAYDSDQLKSKGISPMEFSKRTHEGIHASKDFWKSLEQQKFYGDLPKNEWGGIDLKNCTNRQKAMMGEFQVRFAQSSPDFKKAMENILGREFNAEDLRLAAESVRGTLHGFEDGPRRFNEAQNMQGPNDNGPTAPQKGPAAPTPQAPTPGKPMHQGPSLKSEMPKNFTSANTAGLLNDTPVQTVQAPNKTVGNHAPKALENKDTPNVYRMDPINETKENVVIDGRTDQVLDGVQVPDKETMRNVTPPKGPLKNARPAEFGDLNRRASDNIRDMHDTADAMRQNRLNARLIEASRNGNSPTPSRQGPNKMLGNNFGRNAA